MTDLSGHVALVTGGSRGIGAATARVFAEAGARVIITHRDSAEDAEEVCASMPGEGHRVIQASAAETAAIEAAAASVAESEGRIDVLVNNAARTKVIPHGDMEALTDELFDAILQTNVRGTFATVQALPPGRRRRWADGQHLLARGSDVRRQQRRLLRLQGGDGQQSLARALAPNIRMLSVAPGLVDTQFTSQWDPKVKERCMERTALRRLPTPEDIGRAVLAATTHLTCTTGAIIPVDGRRPLG